MSRGKPKSAMGNLLSRMNEIDTLDGAEVGVAFAARDKEIESTKQTAIKKGESIQEKNFLEIIEIDPNKCTPWQFADRPDDEMGNISSLAESIKMYGQQEPILARKIADGGYEVVFGNRRVRACRLAKTKVSAIVKNISDEDAATFQKEENENREDLSNYARARNYKLLIDSGVFKTAKDLSKKLNISPQNLNDILSFTRIPEELVAMIPNFKSISIKTATKVATLAKDKAKLEVIKKLAPRIGAKTLTHANIENAIENQLMSDSKKSHKDKQQLIENEEGQLMFAIKENSKNELIVRIKKEFLSKEDLHLLEQHVSQYLKN